MANLQNTSITGSLYVSSSTDNNGLTVLGTGSNVVKVSGTQGGELFTISDSINGSLLTVTTGSVNILDVKSNGSVNISGNTIITGPLVSTLNKFSKGGTIANYTSNITDNRSYVVWRAPFSCSVVGLYGWRDGGTSAEINARRSGSNGYSLHTGSNLTISNQNSWTSAGSLANTSYVDGDSLEIIISGSVGSPSQVSVQVDFVRV